MRQSCYFPNIKMLYRKAILEARLFMAEGTVQIEGDVIHVIVNAGHNISKLFHKLISVRREDASLNSLPRADEKTPWQSVKEVAEQKQLFPDARNFR